jgi:ATP-dependent Clp protease ATP-binding subunit ClpX
MNGMFDLPSRDSVERCIVTAEAIRGETEIQLIAREYGEGGELHRSVGR